MEPITSGHHAVVAGTGIFTSDGVLPAEFLGRGDRIITRDGGMAQVRNVSPRQAKTRCIGVAPGCLGNARPTGQVTLLADCPVLLRDWRAKALFGKPRAVVPISRLLDGQYICDLGVLDVHIITLQFDEPHILYADGLEVAPIGQAVQPV